MVHILGEKEEDRDLRRTCQLLELLLRRVNAQEGGVYHQAAEAACLAVVTSVEAAGYALDATRDKVIWRKVP